jgi:hypothetical protein
MPPIRQIKGDRYGRLLVLDRVSEDVSGHIRWSCVCDCGTKRIVRADALVSGITKSCGCLQREVVSAYATKHSKQNGEAAAKAVTTHGRCYSLEYQTWENMIQRCTNPNNDHWKFYGGSGITICAQWRQPKRGFANFISDVGLRPEKNMSLGRFLDTGNYSPRNCTWQTAAEQAAERKGKIARALFRKHNLHLIFSRR